MDPAISPSVKFWFISSNGIAFTRFSFDFRIRRQIIEVLRNPFKTPNYADYDGKFKMAIPIINFMKLIITSLSVSNKPSCISA